jgi:hypothetical protein
MSNLHSANYPKALPLDRGGLGGGDARPVAAREMRIS